MKNKAVLTLTALFMVCLFVVGGVSIMAEYGDSNDPIVTKSYIDSVFTPEINSKIDSQIAKSRQSVESYINDKLAQHVSAVDLKIAQIKNGGITIDSAAVNAIADEVVKQIQKDGLYQSSSWKVVTLEKGKTLVGSVGTELVLRIGSANCYSSGNIGLINLSSGAELQPNKPLLINSLYLVSIAERGVKAVEKATLLVSGEYTIK